MRASALNRIDIWIRLGKPSRPKPHTLGADGAGVVEALGPDTEGPEPGTRGRHQPGPLLRRRARPACAASNRCASASPCSASTCAGAHADYCVVPVRNLHPKPEPLSFAEAAAYPLVFATAWRMLMTRARLQPGEWVLVWGAGLGRRQRGGHARLARSGARVIATASRDDVLAVARERGAVATINHRERGRPGGGPRAHGRPRRRGRLRARRAPRPGRPRSRRCCRGGRLVLTGATTGGNPPARLHRIFWKQLDVLGSTMASDSEFRAVTRLFAQGRIRPLVDSVRPLEDVQEAQRRLEAGEQNGKLVLEISDA